MVSFPPCTKPALAPPDYWLESTGNIPNQPFKWALYFHGIPHDASRAKLIRIHNHYDEAYDFVILASKYVLAEYPDWGDNLGLLEFVDRGGIYVILDKDNMVRAQWSIRKTWKIDGKAGEKWVYGEDLEEAKEYYKVEYEGFVNQKELAALKDIQSKTLNDMLGPNTNDSLADDGQPNGSARIPPPKYLHGISRQQPEISPALETKLNELYEDPEETSSTQSEALNQEKPPTVPKPASASATASASPHLTSAKRKASKPPKADLNSARTSGDARPIKKARRAAKGEKLLDKKDYKMPPKSSQQPSSKKADPDGGDERVYCTCQGKEDGEMVGCDGDNCAVEWYHMKCVKLRKTPPKKWYCLACRGSRSDVPNKAPSGAGKRDKGKKK